MGRIRRLSDELINQIAAGEVVERPASVLKELAENAIDAGATSVRVQLSGGGVTSLTVIDDGHGMSREDAIASFERHATSKLRDSDGLFQITTKGFRGEAIPSIASVSRFTMSTSEPGAVVGTEIGVEGGAPMRVREAAPVGGTRIDVDELFFNVPARRKFLKREATELQHCEEALTRLALAHPEVGFFLEHDGRRLISSPATPARPSERIASLLGAAVEPHLLEVDEQRLGVRVHGLIASPEFTFPTARGLYTFVNRRYVRDRGVTSAVQRAYQDSLAPGRQPVVALFIDVDPASVDVNVHPQKLEVRFSDPRAVQETIGAAISHALKTAPWRQATPDAQSPEALHAHYAQAVDRFLSRASQTPTFSVEPLPIPSAAEGTAGFGTARPTINEAPPSGYFGSLRFLGELGKRFWVCEGQGGSLVVIDPRAVKERVVLAALTGRTLADDEPTLFSLRFEVPEAERVLAHQDALRALGIEIESFGGATIVVKRVPPELEGTDVARWLPQLVTVLDDRDEALRELAFAAASMPMRTVSHDEAHALLRQLDDVDFSRPTKRRTVVVSDVPLLDLQARVLG